MPEGGNVPSMPETGNEMNGQSGQTINQTMTVTIPVPQEYLNKEISVYRIDTNEETKTELNVTVTGESVTFKSNELGTFVLVAEGETSYKKGDADGNGNVELRDAQLALKAALKLIDLSGNDLKAADVNGNGIVELEDAQNILKAALKLQSLE